MARRGSADEELFQESNPLSFSERLTEGAAQANPLMMGRPGLREQYSEPATVPVLEGISPEVVAANPLVRPPRPIKYMPVEQQIIWQERQAAALANQANLQDQLFQNKKSATAAQMELSRQAQSNAILDSLKDLDPTRDDYEERRDKVLAANPIGAISPDVKNLFEYKDKAWDLRRSKRADQEKRILDTQETLRREALSQARKDAVEIGDPSLLEEVGRLSAENPDLAVAKVSQVKSRLAQSNINTQLLQYGLSPEEIQSLYYDPSGHFRADAAAARVKMEESKRVAGEKVASESQLADIVTTLNKQKAEGLSPTAQVEGKSWTPEDQKMLDAYRQRLSIFATEPRTAAPAPVLSGDAAIRAKNEAALQKVTASGPNGEKLIWKNGQWVPY